jgi:hypothetical protein
VSRASRVPGEVFGLLQTATPVSVRRGSKLARLASSIVTKLGTFLSASGIKQQSRTASRNPLMAPGAPGTEFVLARNSLHCCSIGNQRPL